MVRNPKSEGPISLKATVAPGEQRKHWVPKDVSSANGSRGNQGQTGPRSEASANGDKAKLDALKSPEVVAAKQVKAQGKKPEASAEAEASSQQLPNWTIWFHQVQDRRGRRVLPRPGRHQHPIGVL
jgi:hypothetical protein